MTTGPAHREPPPRPGAERYFELRQIKEALSWAEAGGIAVHRNLDRYDGQRSERGMVMRKPFLHVIGLRARLADWAREQGVPLGAIQPEKRRRVAHIDAFGPYAEALMARLYDRRSEAARSPEIVPPKDAPESVG